jgi:hypothetical protein
MNAQQCAVIQAHCTSQRLEALPQKSGQLSILHKAAGAVLLLAPTCSLVSRFCTRFSSSTCCRRLSSFWFTALLLSATVSAAEQQHHVSCVFPGGFEAYARARHVCCCCSHCCSQHQLPAAGGCLMFTGSTTCLLWTGEVPQPTNTTASAAAVSYAAGCRAAAAKCPPRL